MNKRVCVIGGDISVINMFQHRGWDVVRDDMYKPFPTVDLFCFTGGADINPALYGQEPDGARGWDDIRDGYEIGWYRNIDAVGIPMVGICRGAQLLNVLNGGRLIQDHGLISGIVSAWSLYEQDGEEHKVLVDHHQGILPTDQASGFIHGPDVPSGEHIAYACYYPETKSLCFQPHPEWGHKGTEDLFFNLLEEYT